jgi:Kef-type K+ transport system membrane component KefB
MIRTGAGEMDVTVHMLLSLAGVLLGAKIAAQLSSSLGLPAVFGELVLGLVLGPSLLGWLAPSETLQLLADIGVILLMFLAGLETDVVAMRQVGKASFLAAIGGVLLPLSGGVAAGIAFGLPWPRALFLGAVLTATSVSISAQTLRELGRLRSREGATILGAAVIDDVLGVLAFVVVMNIAGSNGEGNVFLALGKMVLFFPMAWLVGNQIIPLWIRWEPRLHHREASLTLLLGFVLVYAWAAEALGHVAAITGAYLLGVLVARRTDTSHLAHHGMAAIGYAFFIPIFFINVGLQAQIHGLWTAPWLTGVLIGLAIFSKIIGCGVGAWLGGLSQRSAIQVGCGMVSRGEVALVIAGAGLSAGLLDGTLFAVLVIVTLGTTLITPPLLRAVCICDQETGAEVSALPIRAEALAD